MNPQYFLENKILCVGEFASIDERKLVTWNNNCFCLSVFAYYTSF